MGLLDFFRSNKPAVNAGNIGFDEREGTFHIGYQINRQPGDDHVERWGYTSLALPHVEMLGSVQSGVAFKKLPCSITNVPMVVNQVALDQGVSPMGDMYMAQGYYQPGLLDGNGSPIGTDTGANAPIIASWNQVISTPDHNSVMYNNPFPQSFKAGAI